MGEVITRQLAVELAARGLPWHPAAGDRFHVPDRDLDDEVFVVSGMSIVTSVPLPMIVCQSIVPPSSPWMSVRTICVPRPRPT